MVSHRHVQDVVRVELFNNCLFQPWSLVGNGTNQSENKMRDAGKRHDEGDGIQGVLLPQRAGRGQHFCEPQPCCARAANEEPSRLLNCSFGDAGIGRGCEGYSASPKLQFFLWEDAAILFCSHTVVWDMMAKFVKEDPQPASIINQN